MSNQTILQLESQKFHNLSQAHPARPILSSREKNWRGIVVDYHQNHHFNELALPPLDEDIIILNLGQTVELSQRRGGEENQSQIKQGDLILLPAGQASWWSWNVETEVLHLRFNRNFLQGIAARIECDRLEAQVRPREYFQTRDPLIEQIGMAFLKELKSDGHRELYIESLTQTLAVHLIEMHSTSLRGQPKTAEKGLARDRLQKAIDYINDNLDAELSLSAIATEIEMSPFYFARLFKGATGLSPHQYIIRCRIERAKGLLAGGNLPILEVCHRVGFQSQSHFTSVFRKFTGLTPKAYKQTL